MLKRFLGFSGMMCVVASAAMADDDGHNLERRVRALEAGAAQTAEAIQALGLQDTVLGQGQVDLKAALAKQAADSAAGFAAVNQSVVETNKNLAATNDHLNATDHNLAATNDRLNQTNESLAATQAHLSAVEGRVARIETVLERAVGWDCTATCQIYRRWNDGYVLMKVETQSGHGLNAAEAMDKVAAQCKTTFESTDYAAQSQLVDPNHQLASIRNSCVQSLAPKKAK